MWWVRVQYQRLSSQNICPIKILKSKRNIPIIWLILTLEKFVNTIYLENTWSFSHKKILPFLMRQTPRTGFDPRTLSTRHIRIRWLDRILPNGQRHILCYISFRPCRLIIVCRSRVVRGSNPTLGVCPTKKSKFEIHEDTTMKHHNIITTDNLLGS